jgi:DNA-binding SARP family transcriptional activator
MNCISDQMTLGARKGSQGRYPPWVVLLFGRFNARVGNASLETLPGRRTKELLGYLLLFRERAHHREVLAGTLWPESSTAQSRNYLRQGLWHLRTLDGMGSGANSLVSIQPDWVQANRANLWLDVAELEEAFGPVKLVPGEQLDAEQARRLGRVVPLYRGDLLEGCYEDWCTYERERLRAMYIALLEKLLGYCEAHGQHEEGLMYGEKLLGQDRAHERAHWRLMRLHYLAGDRTGALRQFGRCRDALKEELGVAPGERIVSLYEQIRADQGLDPLTVGVASPAARASGVAAGRPGNGAGQPGNGAGLPAGLPREALLQATAPLHAALRALSLVEQLMEEIIQATQRQDG